jgi:PAS domain S-box-containing protein
MAEGRERSDSPSSELKTARQRIVELEEKLYRADAQHEALRLRETRFRILSELISDSCWARFKAADGVSERLWVNEAFEQLTGYTPEEFESVGREVLVHPDDLESVLELVDGPLGVTEHEFRIVCKNGDVRWLHERMSVSREPDGSLNILGATQDITARKHAEKVLQEAHQVEVGMDGHLIKPYRQEDLASILTYWLPSERAAGV